MTAIVHDPENIAHHHLDHPERPERYQAILEALSNRGLLERMADVPLREATSEEMARVHDHVLVSRIEEALLKGGGMLDPDTYCTPASWDIARRAAGGLTDLCLAVARGEAANGLAVLRPPGHHVTRTVSMGFGLINLAAIAARALQDAQVASRIAIVDFDVHHGNGTEDIFADDPTVFYASTHQYPHYPGTGRARDTGTGAGTGTTLNIPLAAGTGDDEFLAAYRENILPAVENFAPDFLLVSAGYDAHRDDPLAGLEVSDEGFQLLEEELMALAHRCCGGKIVMNLEGGYHLEALGRCVGHSAARLLAAASGKDLS
jgi:acetoin utilization deacetylase AcuC-like enzyme|nr:histone deacetylase [Candidatus Krumholzibacteria bacterium]